MMLLLNGENHEAKRIVNKCLESMLEDWNYSTSSLEKFSKLQTLSEIDVRINVSFVIVISDLELNIVKRLDCFKVDC